MVTNARKNKAATHRKSVSCDPGGSGTFAGNAEKIDQGTCDRSPIGTHSSLPLRGLDALLYARVAAEEPAVLFVGAGFGGKQAQRFGEIIRRPPDFRQQAPRKGIGLAFGVAGMAGHEDFSCKALGDLLRHIGVGQHKDEQQSQTGVAPVRLQVVLGVQMSEFMGAEGVLGLATSIAIAKPPHTSRAKNEVQVGATVFTVDIRQSATPMAPFSSERFLVSLPGNRSTKPPIPVFE